MLNTLKTVWSIIGPGVILYTGYKLYNTSPYIQRKKYNTLFEQDIKNIRHIPEKYVTKEMITKVFKEYPKWHDLYDKYINNIIIEHITNTFYNDPDFFTFANIECFQELLKFDHSDTLTLDILIKKMINIYPHNLLQVPNKYISQKLCDEIFNTNVINIKYIPTEFITNEMVKKALDIDLNYIEFVPDIFITREISEKVFNKDTNNFNYIPTEFKTIDMLYSYVDKKTLKTTLNDTALVSAYHLHDTIIDIIENIIEKEKIIDITDLIYYTFTGIQFNKLVKIFNLTLVKLTNNKEYHNGYQFIDGLNIDTIKFNNEGACLAGGFYFIDIKYIERWNIEYNKNVGKMYWIRNVIIPDDAKVYIENDKFKVDKFILDVRKKIN